jgi:pyrroloquinoline quinone biosynthesis protein B
MTHVQYAAVVLGSGQDGGVPQLGAPAGPERTASSVAVGGEDGISVLLDASPDLRLQQRRLVEDPAYSGRPGSNAFDALLLTHAHMGHYVGLAHFGKESHNADRLPCFATRPMLGFLQRNEPWAALFRNGNLVAEEIEAGVEFEVAPGWVVRAHLVPHRPEFSDTVAFEVRVPSGTSVLYLPDLDYWSGWPAAADVIAGVDVALVDATFYGAAEHPGRDLDDIPHPFVTETVALLSGLTGATRIVLTHLNWTNCLCDPQSPEIDLVGDAGFEVAYDGMRVAL